MASAPSVATPVSESTDQMLQAYSKNLPGLMGTYNAQQTPTAQAQLAAQQATQPGYDALNLSQYNQMAPAYANSQANTNLGLINGSGADIAKSGVALNNALNPSMAAATNRTQDLLGAINLNGLSPGESNAVERSNNQNLTSTGNLGVNNGTNTISNAMNFGGAFNNKVGMLGNAIGTATGTANAQNSQVNPTALATGNFLGGNQFTNPQLAGTTSPSAANGFANTVMGGVSGLAQQNAEAQNKLNYANSNQGVASSFGANNVYSGGSGGGLASCCFIFMEIYNGTLPWYVREERDYYYKKDPRLSIGYKKMAKWLVPLMKESRLVKTLVNWTMVKPITYYGGWKHNLNSFGWLTNPIRILWFTIWKLTN